MKRGNRIISILLTICMLITTMTSVAFAETATTLPTKFGWSTDNPGKITITVPAFSGEEVEYALDLYRNGVLVDVIFSNIFNSSGTVESEVFADEIKKLGAGTYTYRIGLTRDENTLELLNYTSMSSSYVKSSTGGNTGGGTGGGSSANVDRSSVTDRNYDAAKVMYDLGIMPDVYEKHDQTFTRGDFAVIMAKYAGKYDTAMQCKDAFSNYLDIEIGTKLNGCICVLSNFMNCEFITSGDGNFEPNAEMTYAEAIKVIFDLLGYKKTAQKRGGYPFGYMSIANDQGITNGLFISNGTFLTYEQLSYFLYSELNTKLMKQTSGFSDEEYAFVDDTVLTDFLGMGRLTGSVVVSGNNTTVTGVIYTHDKPRGEDVENMSFTNADKDLLSYADEDVVLYIKDDVIKSAIKYENADFSINNGDEKALTTDLNIKFDVYGRYSKYRFVIDNDETEYIPLTEKNISYKITNADGNHSIKIEFANDDETLTKTVSHSILFDNKHTVTAMVNGTVYKTYALGCGSKINFPKVTVDGYWLKGWDKPADYIMPDEDITITAKMVPLATISGRFLNEDSTPSFDTTIEIKTYKEYGNQYGIVSAYSDANGNFSVVYPQGEHIFSINNYPISTSIEVNANKSEVNLGDIVLSRKGVSASAYNQIETIKGFTDILDSFITSDDEELLLTDETTVSLNISAGGIPVIDNNSVIAKSIASEYGNTDSVMYFDISLSKQKRFADGERDSTSIYETPALIEFKVKVPDNMLGKDDYAFVRSHKIQTGDATTEAIENITKNPNEFGEYYTFDGEYIRLFTKRFSTYALIGFNEAEKPAHKTVTYMVGDTAFKTVNVAVGLEIPELTDIPDVAGYRFDGWETIPETMPDEDIVINAKMTKISTVKGIVQLGDNPLENATISIAGETATTNANGEYSVVVPCGEYMLTAKKDGMSKTVTVNAKDIETNVSEITLSAKSTNITFTEPTVKTVDGLDTLLENVISDDDATYLQTPGNTITVNAKAEPKTENTEIGTALINTYSKYTAALYIDFTLEKVKGGAETTSDDITETNSLIAFKVAIPESIKNKAEFIILREHNGAVDALTTTPNADGEYIKVENGFMTIYANKFSTYALAGKDADPVVRSGGGGGSTSYTVKFETNGGSTLKSVSAKRNVEITEPTAPTKEGYTFDGWYSDKELKTKFDFTTKISKSITLYAKWTENAVKTSTIILTIGEKSATINGETKENDVAPKIVNDRTMLPIRFIAETLGAKVDWAENTQTVTISAEGIEISLVIGENFATVNGENVELDSPSFIENDRTYLPIRFVSEKLGAKVDWDETAQTVTITK